jgi:hypothetical protein
VITVEDRRPDGFEVSPIGCGCLVFIIQDGTQTFFQIGQSCDLHAAFTPAENQVSPRTNNEGVSS